MSESRQQAVVPERNVDISGGDFSDLPGSAWKTPPLTNYDGIVVTALRVMDRLRDQAGSFDFRPFGADIWMTVRYLGIRPYASEPKHIFHVVGGEFELLLIIGLDVRTALIACRGNREALQHAVEQVEAAYSAAGMGVG
ncbi:hypothetical protein [Brevundimonas goettingensis]|uniref:Uncharacterized protein n=1 Tax=Brevundimonas goettingensis TaxID=2774190 RepID=A0A975C020_9CAUL|nr:hypothetical protein [Brevundimonas goettingensis]QTC90860.1 hypothetical protein IFJ75_16780 [Brevundimonas goettingensis]